MGSNSTTCKICGKWSQTNKWNKASCSSKCSSCGYRKYKGSAPGEGKVDKTNRYWKAAVKGINPKKIDEKIRSSVSNPFYSYHHKKEMSKEAAIEAALVKYREKHGEQDEILL